MSDAPTPPPSDVPPPTVNYQSPVGKGPVYQGPPPSKDDCTMAMLCHLLAILTGFIGPLIIWLIKKDTSPFVDDQGKESLNFQITLFFGYIIGVVTACLIIGYFVIFGLWICSIIFCIMATMAANKGIAYRYPVAVRLIK